MIMEKRMKIAIHMMESERRRHPGPSSSVQLALQSVNGRAVLPSQGGPREFVLVCTSRGLHSYPSGTCPLASSC